MEQHTTPTLRQKIKSFLAETEGDAYYIGMWEDALMALVEPDPVARRMLAALNAAATPDHAPLTDAELKEFVILLRAWSKEQTAPYNTERIGPGYLDLERMIDDLLRSEHARLLTLWTRNVAE